MEIENVAIDKLIQYEFNNKIHDDTQIDRIANSIKEFGFLQPLVIEKDNTIIVGHGRYLGAKKLGLKELPCVRVENLTDEQIKKYRILDNRLNESAYNMENLKVELDELDNFNIGDLEISVDELFPDLQEVNGTSPGNQKIQGNKEITPDDLGGFQHKCPACGFEFNDDEFTNDDDNDDEL